MKIFHSLGRWTMTSGSTFLLAVLAVVITCTAVSAAARRPANVWNYYHFVGQGFVAGQPADNSPFLAVQNRVQPVVLTRSAKIEAVALPPDKGALAGICYIQSSGGKLGAGHGYTPCSRTPVTISSGNNVETSVLSDENGYYIALLTAGRYRIGSGLFAVEVTVENGTTVLAPLRAGKRMVD